MTKYLGTTKDLIDWDSIIADIRPRTGDHNTVSSVVDRSESNWADNPTLLGSYHEIISTWQRADYDLTNIEWWDYYPGQHFDISVQEKFADLVNADPLRVFVSEVMPGQCAPYHWDVEDKGAEWLKKYGMLYRYTCCIDVPRTGSVLIVDDHCLYDFKQGDIFEWDSYRNYHSAANGGEHTQYYFHMLGYKIKC